MKPGGCKFEFLEWVRDGSESTVAKNIYKKGMPDIAVPGRSAHLHSVSLRLYGYCIALTGQYRKIGPPTAQATWAHR